MEDVDKARTALDPSAENEIPIQTIEWLKDVIGGAERVLSVRWMGRSSTAMHAVDVVNGAGAVRRLALRRYVDAERLATDPWYRPEQEAEALRILEEARLPTPRLVAADPSAARCDAPALLVTRITGRPLRRRPRDMDAYLWEAARLLHRVHQVSPGAAASLPTYAPYEASLELVIPAWSRRPAMWASVLDALSRSAPPNEGRFIHRDYHPGNILRSRSRVTGVIDWTTACRGPRSIDLARMRLNLASDFGLDEAERFLSIYGELAGGFTHDPYWDLLDAVDSAQDAQPPASRAASASWDRFEQWVAQQLSH